MKQGKVHKIVGTNYFSFFCYYLFPISINQYHSLEVSVPSCGKRFLIAVPHIDLKLAEAASILSVMFPSVFAGLKI